jgi:outer membrane lipoprotein SlyB
MSFNIETLNLGTYPNDGQGDDLRTAFEKVQNNFDEVRNKSVTNATNLGSGPGQVFYTRTGNDLQFRSVTSLNSNLVITKTDDEIWLLVKDSINHVSEDSTPVLGGNLNLNTFLITGTGNIDIAGDILANNVSGALHGTVTGDVYGNVFGNVTGTVTGNVTGQLTGSMIGNVTGSLFGNVTGNVTGDLNGNVYGNVYGDLTGNVTGTVSDITNHSLEELSNVESLSPSAGQVLAWSDNKWKATTITSGVSKILAGSNVTISPLSGTGEVTINVSNTSVYPSEFNFGNFGNATNPIELLMQITPVDFGTILGPQSAILDLGTIS